MLHFKPSFLLAAFMLLFMTFSFAQEQLGYQIPPKAILDLVDVERAPSVRMDNDKDHMVLLYRPAFKSISQLSKKELRLGGLRIDPQTSIGSRVTYSNNIRVQDMQSNDNAISDVKGLPADPQLANFTWSPNQEMMAFTNTTTTGVELWVLDVKTASAKKLTDANINANLSDVINWFDDNKSILVKKIPQNRKDLIDTQNSTPSGPTVTVADGKKAQNRTYQDLLANKNDEFNFEQLAHSDLYKVTIDGQSNLWLPSAMYHSISFSPNGEYVMVRTVERPFSYIVPYRRFASKLSVYDTNGQLVHNLSDLPVIEDLPKGFMSCATGPRSYRWRSDKPATLIYAQALDGGDPAVKVNYRDEVFQLEAPFNRQATSLIKLKNRFSGITWATDDMAIASDYWWNTRNTKSYIFNPSDNTVVPEILYDRSYQDTYSDPGSFVMQRNEYGSFILAMEDGHAYLIGDGFTKEGQFPFLDKLNLKTKKVERVYQSAYTDKLENIFDYDIDEQKLMVSIESPNEYPNYYFRDINNKKAMAITTFENPFESISEVHKEVITYNREDGLELSGTLYLPVGYDMNKKEKMPMILWAYPREYKDKASASQNTKNPNEFTYPFYGTPIYWVTRGYAVLDDAAFPIVGEGDSEPNDSFRSQLVSNAKAAIDAVDKLGYIDRNRVGVGGHSYGAFMVANLLSHSDLFAAGIARSGAYNRTLTPFGFQSEERSYWEAPDIYNTMSPFMHADKMKTPLLLVHGEADNNSGTYPLQSQRYFNALKGLGATVRLVMLPKESHGYRAKESILHLLWEQDQWLEKYVKNANVDEVVESP
jgi:dipeptidyl aminopeptidase/acylaminoacyl peptidase